MHLCFWVLARFFGCVCDLARVCWGIYLIVLLLWMLLLVCELVDLVLFAY